MKNKVITLILFKAIRSQSPEVRFPARKGNPAKA
jgi:hypothetical protein